MVRLEPMSIEQYESWLHLSIAEYAAEKVHAGNATADEALAVSQQEFDQLLPDGRKFKGKGLWKADPAGP